jgi:NhaP-type Na+/H+ or K+/H+ antiporter
MLHNEAALVVAIALAAGVVIQSVARLTRVPAIILLLAAGAGLGPAGIDWVRSSALGDGLFVLVDFAVAIILFEGALNLDVARLRREERVIRRLITGGAMLTLAGAALAAKIFLGWPWTLSLLFGSLVVVTGPTVVGPLIRTLRLRPRVQTVLEAEGVFIDPVGALLAVLVLQAILATDALAAVAGMRDLATRLIVGIALGLSGGFGLMLLLKLRVLVRGLENVLALALVTLLFHVAEHVVSQSGLIAVTAAGVIVGNFENPVTEDLREFKDQLTMLLIGALFVLLAADVRLDEVRALGWGGAAVVLALIGFVRPAGVWLVTSGLDFTARERAFLSAIAPRGIVAAAVASVIAATLEAEGIPGGNDVRALVFLVIAGTVVAAGVLAWPLAAALGLRLPARDRIAILGAQGLGLALAAELKAADESVVLIDTDPQRCQSAERQGFTVVYGNGLEERTLRRARIELVGTAVGATFNDYLNSQFVGYARDAFDVPRGYVSIDTADGGPPAYVARRGGEVLFDGPHDQERWDVRWRQNEVTIAAFEFNEPPGGEEAEPAAGGRPDSYVILTIRRGRRTEPMRPSIKPRPGDRAAVAIYARAEAQALEQLASTGWQPVGPRDQARAADAVPTSAG